MLMDIGFIYMAVYAVFGKTMRPAVAVVIEYTIRLLIN